MGCNHVYESPKRMLKKTKKFTCGMILFIKNSKSGKTYTVRNTNNDGKTIKKIKNMIISKVKIATSGRSNTKSADFVLLLDLNVSYTRHSLYNYFPSCTF